MPWTKSTPSCTSGTPSFDPVGSAQLHARRRLATLLLVICVNGLNPCASQVRRHVSHSDAGGVASIASVTGVYVSSGLGLATFGAVAA